MQKGWYFGTYDISDGYKASYYSEPDFNSPKEATEEALIYTLKNL